MMQVHMAFSFLANAARGARPKVVPAMRTLYRHTEMSEVRRFLTVMQVDAMDLWIAYHLLSRREVSPSGRDACAWLAATLGQALRAPDVRRRGKGGALLLWAVLSRMEADGSRAAMYRNALGLLSQGRDSFRLGPLGPVQIREDSEALSGDRMSEVRAEIQTYFTGDRQADLRGFVGDERRIAEIYWEQERRRRHDADADAEVEPGILEDILADREPLYLAGDDDVEFVDHPA